MPSMRPFPLNPQPPAAPGSMPAPDIATVPMVQTSDPSATAVPSAAGGGQPAAAYVRAGGFHESSYELHHGLQVSESEWSEDFMVPASQDAH
jgi:hypothetical protein